MMMLICTKQHLSNICGSIHEKVSNTAAELKKGVAYKKKRVTHFLRKEHFQFFALFEAQKNRTTMDTYDSISPRYDSTCIVLP